MILNPNSTVIGPDSSAKAYQVTHPLDGTTKRAISIHKKDLVAGETVKMICIGDSYGVFQAREAMRSTFEVPPVVNQGVTADSPWNVAASYIGQKSGLFARFYKSARIESIYGHLAKIKYQEDILFENNKLSWVSIAPVGGITIDDFSVGDIVLISLRDYSSPMIVGWWEDRGTLDRWIMTTDYDHCFYTSSDGDNWTPIDPAGWVETIGMLSPFAQVEYLQGRIFFNIWESGRYALPDTQNLVSVKSDYTDFRVHFSEAVTASPYRPELVKKDNKLFYFSANLNVYRTSNGNDWVSVGVDPMAGRIVMKKPFKIGSLNSIISSEGLPATGGEFSFYGSEDGVYWYRISSPSPVFKLVSPDRSHGSCGIAQNSDGVIIGCFGYFGPFGVNSMQLSTTLNDWTYKDTKFQEVRAAGKNFFICRGISTTLYPQVIRASSDNGYSFQNINTEALSGIETFYKLGDSIAFCEETKKTILPLHSNVYTTTRLLKLAKDADPATDIVAGGDFIGRNEVHRI